MIRVTWSWLPRSCKLPGFSRQGVLQFARFACLPPEPLVQHRYDVRSRQATCELQRARHAAEVVTHNSQFHGFGELAWTPD